jgi:hypothetical protein
VPGQLVERAKRGQLKALPHQLFDGDIDQIGRVVHHLGGAIRGFDCNVSCLATPAADLEVVADALVMAVQRARRDIKGCV